MYQYDMLERDFSIDFMPLFMFSSKLFIKEVFETLKTLTINASSRMFTYTISRWVFKLIYKGSPREI